MQSWRVCLVFGFPFIALLSHIVSRVTRSPSPDGTVVLESSHGKLALVVARRKLQESWLNQHVGYFVGNIRTFTLYIASADDWESYRKVRATDSLGSTVRSGKLADVGEDNVVLANLQFLDHPHIRESYGNVSYAQKGVHRM